MVIVALFKITKITAKIYLLGTLLSLIMIINAYANINNYKDRSWQHAFSFTISNAISHKGALIKNIYTGNFEKNRILLTTHYKLPNNFFRLNGSRNILIGLYPAPESDDKIYFVGLSQVVNLVEFKKIYFNCELGAIYGSDITKRIGSRLCIMTNIELGVIINNYNIGIVKNHFSNANLTIPNIGENFFGILFGIKFK